MLAAQFLVGGPIDESTVIVGLTGLAVGLAGSDAIKRVDKISRKIRNEKGQINAWVERELSQPD